MTIKLFLDLRKVILPIGFLEEELEKAQFAAAFGRFCNSEIMMLLANDYGSKAATNAAKMEDLFNKFDFKHTLKKATKDSFKIPYLCGFANDEFPDRTY